MQLKKVITIAIFALAAMILILGITQVSLFLSPQLTMLSEARTEGATEQQISDYYWQQLMPQALLYIFTFLGLSGILAACGATYMALQRNAADAEELKGLLATLQTKTAPVVADESKSDEHDFFEDFETVEDPKQKE